MTQDASAPREIVVVGSINTDYTGRASSLPTPGETVRGKHFSVQPGGKGANQAIAASRLGGRTALVGTLGDDERGHVLVQHLRRENVNADYVGTAAGAPSGAAVIQVDDRGEKQILMVEGANRRLSPADVQDAAALLRAATVVITQLEVSLEVVTAAVRLGHDAGVCVILDPAPVTSLSDDLLRMVSIIRPNADEAAALTGIHVHDRASALQAAQALRQRGVGVVAVGVGSQGNLLAWQGGQRWYPGIPVESVDATGAGDAFIGALATQLAHGTGLSEAGQFANAAAALATTQAGAQAGLPTEHDVRRLLAATRRDG